MKKKPEDKKEPLSDDEKFPLPIYTAEEDIYSKEKEIPFKEKDEKKLNAKLSNDLDVPGAELDDEDEEIGEEDEENNYYSLGGDNHNDLDEDKEEDR
jgi:hypothetical protein